MQSPEFSHDLPNTSLTSNIISSKPLTMEPPLSQADELLLKDLYQESFPVSTNNDNNTSCNSTVINLESEKTDSCADQMDLTNSCKRDRSYLDPDNSDSDIASKKKITSTTINSTSNSNSSVSNSNSFTALSANQIQTELQYHQTQQQLLQQQQLHHQHLQQQLHHQQQLQKDIIPDLPSCGSSSPSHGSSSSVTGAEGKKKERIRPATDIGYQVNNAGPYELIVEPINPQLPPNKLHPTTIGRLLCKIYNGKVNNVKSIGISRIKFFASDLETANSIVNNPDFKKHNLKFLVPSYRLSRQVIIRHVSLVLTDEDIQSELSTNYPSLIDVERLKRRSGTDTIINLVPSQSILLTFSGQSLPNEIFLCGVKHQIFPYIPPIKICFKCFRFGHIHDICKSNQICIQCGDSAHEDPAACPKKEGDFGCVNCKGYHSPRDKSCPEWSLQLKIRSLAVTRNISIADASDEIYKVDPPHHISRSLISIQNRNAKSDQNSSRNSCNIPLVHDPSTFKPPNFTFCSSKLPFQKFIPNSSASFSSMVRRNSPVSDSHIFSSTSTPSYSPTSQSFSPDDSMLDAIVNSDNPNRNANPTRYKNSSRNLSEHNSLLISPNGRTPSQSTSFTPGFSPDNPDSNMNTNFSFSSSDPSSTLSFIDNFFKEFIFPLLNFMGHSDKIQIATYVFNFLRKTVLNDA